MSTTAISGKKISSETGVKWRRGALVWQETLAGYLFATPALLGLLTFTALPIVASLVLVFLNYDLLTPPTWAGSENITRLFSDQRMFTIYWNTVRLVVGATLLNNVLGLLLAVGVNRSMPSVLRYFLRTSIFFPVLTTTASLAVVWRFLLTQDRGVVNFLLGQIGIDPVPWLSSSTWALISAIIEKLRLLNGDLPGRSTRHRPELLRSCGD